MSGSKRRLEKTQKTKKKRAALRPNWAHNLSLLGFVLGATFRVILACWKAGLKIYNSSVACFNKSVVKQINSAQMPVRVQSIFIVSLYYF